MKEGWEMKSLGEVCELIGGGTPSKKNTLFYGGDIPWATVRDLSSDNVLSTEHSITKEAVKGSSTNIINSGNVVISTRVGLGKICIIHQNTAINQDLRGIIPFSKEMLSVKYLFYWFKSIAHIIVNAGTGATVQGVKVPFVKSLQIPIPPLAEQEEIVEVLDKAFAAIDQAKANIEQNIVNAKELFQSKLNQIFSQKGEGWVEKSLSEITTHISDGDHSAPPKSETGIPFITISNIDKESLNIDFSSTFMVPEDYYTSLKPHRKPEMGDVLYTVTGSFGIPVHISNTKAFCFQRHIGLLRPDEKTDGRFLFYLMQSPQVYIQAVSGATGTAQRTVSLTLLRKMKVPCVPLGQQKAIVKHIDSLSESTSQLESHYQTKLTSLDELKKSILQKAFAGELTK